MLGCALDELTGSDLEDLTERMGAVLDSDTLSPHEVALILADLEAVEQELAARA